MNTLVQRLRDNADIDEAEGCTASVVALEREAADRIAQLETDLAEARKDQARYQFMRNRALGVHKDDMTVIDDFEAVIDAAIKGQQ